MVVFAGGWYTPSNIKEQHIYIYLKGTVRHEPRAVHIQSRTAHE